MECLGEQAGTPEYCSFTHAWDFKSCTKGSEDEHAFFLFPLYFLYSASETRHRKHLTIIKKNIPVNSSFPYCTVSSVVLWSGILFGHLYNRPHGCLCLGTRNSWSLEHSSKNDIFVSCRGRSLDSCSVSCKANLSVCCILSFPISCQSGL